jgi:hypothetical protein
VINRIKEIVKDLKWLIESRKFKNRYKKGRGEDFHHE